MSASMLARRQLRLAVLPVLEALTGVTVESPPVTPTAPKQMPYVGLACGVDRKVAVGKSVPQFTTTTTLKVLARVSASTGQAAQDAIEALGYQIEQAVLGLPAFISLVQQISNVTTTTEISAEGSQYQAGLEIDFDCELFEIFDPTQINPGNYPALQGVDVHVDTVRPYDGDGVYLAPPFPDAVTPAPRTAGPDGRDEGALQINFPQE